MKQYSHLKTTFTELFLALTLNYEHDFIMHADGTLYCMAYPALSFELNQIDITVIACRSHNATLYLIKTKGVLLKGTFIEYHEI